MKNEPKILIIGAGPTGLGAAWRLHELGYQNWQLVDEAKVPGGLASSVIDEHGFTWDLGGHVLFSHYEYFDALMDTLLGKKWVEHIRESWVWMRERFIPYPLQNNIWRLPPKDLIPSLEGLVQVHATRNQTSSPKTFREWILRTFGQGLAETFMLPYNRKVWAYNPAELNISWMGERVATVDLNRILHNLVLQQDDCSWGPNAKFRFPSRGGTGTIWQALAQRLPANRIKLNRRVVEVSTKTRTAHLSNEEILNYDYLISTIPLDVLLRIFSDQKQLSKKASHFKHSSSHIIGIGIQGRVPEKFRTKCWMYFPEPDVPFYRVTIFSNYSPYNVPRPGKQWSLLCEVSESPKKKVNLRQVVNDTIKGLRRAQLLPKDAKILSRWHRRLEHGYPTPFLKRDSLLQSIDSQLRKINILSRGRFGAWKYEVSNQDHSLMQGVEAVQHILFGSKETTYSSPSKINAAHKMKNTF